MIRKTDTTVWNTATSFLLKLIPCSCFISLLVASSTNALPVQAETFQSSILKSEPSIASQNLQNMLAIDTNKRKAPLFINFNDMKPQNTFEVLKEKYLTFYKGKKEKLKATYIHGAYALNYIQKW